MAITIRSAREAYRDGLPSQDNNKFRILERQQEDSKFHFERLMNFEAQVLDFITTHFPNYDKNLALDIFEIYEGNYRAALKEIKRGILELVSDHPDKVKKVKDAFLFLSEFDPNPENRDRRLQAQKKLGDIQQKQKDERVRGSAERKGIRLR